MKINFNNKLFTKKYISWINICYAKAEKVLNLGETDIEVNIAFVSNKEIKKLNSEFRNVDKVTDVLSFPQVDLKNFDLEKLNKKDFPFDINNETGNLILGDIYICASKVKKQHKEFGTSMQREMCYMSIHGLLHLLGYDHIEENDKKEMRKMEEKILGALDIVK